jgi:hypothetical protein
MQADELPRFIPMTQVALEKKMCPDVKTDCTKLVAVFDHDSYLVYYASDQIDVKSFEDRSYLLHEIVHVLQERYNGIGMFSTCANLHIAEVEAYEAQNDYLKYIHSKRRMVGYTAAATCRKDVTWGR